MTGTSSPVLIANLRCPERAYPGTGATARTSFPCVEKSIDQFQYALWTDRDTATAISADIAVNRQFFSSLIQQHVHLLVFFLS